MFCAYCNLRVDLEAIRSRNIESYVVELPDRKEIFCSAKCGNEYCIDKNIPFRFCINPNCGERGVYHKKTIIIPPYEVYCHDCFLKAKITCECCGREYYINRSKARKANNPERFCSKKCEKEFYAKNNSKNK